MRSGDQIGHERKSEAMKVMIMRSRGVHHSKGDALQGVQMIQWHEMDLCLYGW